MIIWARVCVFLYRTFTADEGEIVGYYRNFGIQSVSVESAREVLLAEIDDGTIEWADSEFQPVQLTDLSLEFRRMLPSPQDVGIWYQSGRVFFPN